MNSETLMLLPGLLCDDAVWTEQIKVLSAERECRVADYADADTIEGMASIVLAVAPPRFALAGHSMGGRVALEVMRQAPHRVSRLALLDTGYESRPGGEAGEHERLKRQRLIDLAHARGMRAMGEDWLIGMVHPAHLQCPELRESILAMIERKTLHIYESQIRALLARPDATSLLAKISCPTSVICGRQDDWSPLSRHERMVELIPGSRLVVIEDSGHMSTMEQPTEVLAALQDWLSMVL